MMAKLYDNFKILIFVNKINIINNLYMEEVKKMISKKEKVFYGFGDISYNILMSGINFCLFNKK